MLVLTFLLNCVDEVHARCFARIQRYFFCIDYFAVIIEVEPIFDCLSIFSVLRVSDSCSHCELSSRSN